MLDPNPWFLQSYFLNLNPFPKPSPKRIQPPNKFETLKCSPQTLNPDIPTHFSVISSNPLSKSSNIQILHLRRHHHWLLLKAKMAVPREFSILGIESAQGFAGLGPWGE